MWGVGGCGGGERHTDTYIYVPSVNNHYKRDYMVICVMVIEKFHKIINWYMKDAK